jgi:hypothetical protein
MLEELSRLKKVSTEGLQRAKAIAGASKSFQNIIQSISKGELPAREAADKTKEYISTINSELDSQKKLLTEVTALVERIEQAQLDNAKGVKPLDMARQLKSVVDSVQNDLNSQLGSVGTVLRGFDVELKGVVVVENSETRVMLPPPTEKLEAHQVSTFKMSFGTVPLVRPDNPASDPQK